MEEAAKKKCPACAEEILAEALKCKHCGERFGAPTSGPAVPPPRVSANAIVTTAQSTEPLPLKSALLSASFVGILTLSFIWVGVVRVAAPNGPWAGALLMGAMLALVVALVAWLPPTAILVFALRKTSPTARMPMTLGFAVLHAAFLSLLHIGGAEGFSGKQVAKPEVFVGILAVGCLVSAFAATRLRPQLQQQAKREA